MRVSTREADVLKACLDYLRLKGVLHWRQNTAGIRRQQAGREFWTAPALRGVSDILGLLPPTGRLLAVECKSATGSLTADQRQFLSAITLQGGLALCVRSVAELDEQLSPHLERSREQADR